MEKKEMKFYRLILDVCRVINSTLDVKKVLRLLSENVTQALDAKACAIFLWNREQDTLEVSASFGLSDAYLQKGRLHADDSLKKCSADQSVLIFDAITDPRTQYPEEAKKGGIASMFSVPICAKGTTLGALRVYLSEAREFSANESEFVHGLAEMGGIAIENARMYSHLKGEHESLMMATHQWFEFGRTE
jgi:signal transduction protein with GAF and PtsI domain